MRFKYLLAAMTVGLTLATTTTAGAAYARTPQVPRLDGAGIAIYNSVKWITAMRSAPHNDTYFAGNARPGDQLYGFCYIWMPTGYWDLVINFDGFGGEHYRYTAAFINEANLNSTAQDTPCSSLAPRATTAGNIAMRSAPHNDTYYVGTAHRGDRLVPLGFVDMPDGRWILLLEIDGYGGDHYGYTAAFIKESNLIYY